MRKLSTVPELDLPTGRIWQEANGNYPAALKLAAAFGYRLACRDMDKVSTATELRLPEAP